MELDMDLYYPFNAIGGDRLHDADDLARIIRAMITSGVAMVDATDLQAQATDDFNVTVRAGVCVQRGRIGENDSDKIVTLAAPYAGADRIDRIVARADYAARKMKIVYLQGTPASSPTAPTLKDDADGCDLPLAQIAVKQAASSITQTDITDERAVCELIVPGSVNALVSQLRSGFNAWMTAQETTFQAWNDRVRAALESTEAGQVLSLIAQLQTGKQNVLSAENPLPLAGGGLGTSCASAAEARIAIGAATPPVLLWTNASPTSTFAAQTLNIDLSAYQSVLIVYRWSASSAIEFATLCRVGKTTCCYSAYDMIRARIVTVNTASVVWMIGTNAYYGTSGATESADTAIPVAIYGIKGVGA